MIQDYYPTPTEVDQWCAELQSRAGDIPVEAEVLTDQPTWEHRLGLGFAPGHYVAFRSPGRETWYGYWQPTPSGGPAPLLVHVPGYGAEVSAHPELVAAGFNVLHVNPLGYGTPTGPDLGKQVEEFWPVFPDTVNSGGERGYRNWLTDALLAIRWARELACVQPQRVGTFGCSQGGGGALLLGSLLGEQGARAVAADVPFLTGIVTGLEVPESAYGSYVLEALRRIEAERPQDLPAAGRALGLVDTLSHAHRLTMPVLLTAGDQDVRCPAPQVESLFDRLPGTRSFTLLQHQPHGNTSVFLYLARAWFSRWV